MLRFCRVLILFTETPLCRNCSRKMATQSKRKMSSKTAEGLSLPIYAYAHPLRLWRGYLHIMELHPLKTQATTAFLFAGIGNILSQCFVEKRSPTDLDWFSVGKFSLIALFVSFPLVRTWLGILERLVKPSKYAAVKKVILDQSIFAPSFLVLFIVLMGFVEGTGWEDAKNRLRTGYSTVLMNNYKVWPAANLINFYLVPFNHRILFGSLVGLLWNIYLATVARQGGAPQVNPSIE